MNCPICNSSGKNIFDSFYKCNNCAFIWNYDKFNYNKEKYSQKEINDIYFNSVKNIFLYSLGKINKYSSKGKLLDIGCAYGYFLKLALKDGWKAEGIEIDKNKVEKCLNDGLKVYLLPVDEINVFSNTYDVITLFSVLSQVEDLDLLFKFIEKNLKTNGILFIRDYNSYFHYYMFKLLSHFPFLNTRPFIFHNWNFSKNSIEVLLEKYNFEIIEFRPSILTSGDPYNTGGFLGKYGVSFFKFIYFIFSYFIYYLTLRKILISSSFIFIARKKI